MKRHASANSEEARADPRRGGSRNAAPHAASWLDENLPRLVERMVQAEIEDEPLLADHRNYYKVEKWSRSTLACCSPAIRWTEPGQYSRPSFAVDPAVATRFASALACSKSGRGRTDRMRSRLLASRPPLASTYWRGTTGCVPDRRKSRLATLTNVRFDQILLQKSAMRRALRLARIS